MIIVSRKPIMAGYQLLVFKMLYINVMLICDTLINDYLLTIKVGFKVVFIARTCFPDVGKLPVHSAYFFH